MGDLLGKKEKPQSDAELERMRAAEQARLAKEKQDQENKTAEDEAARLRRLRGTRSLLGGDFTGFGLGSSSTLGG